MNLKHVMILFMVSIIIASYINGSTIVYNIPEIQSINCQSRIINATGIDYIFLSNLTENNDAVNSGYGVYNAPIVPVKYLLNQPDYVFQKILAENTTAINHGFGPGYSPSVPIRTLFNPPDYTIQWILVGWNNGGNGSFYPPIPPVKVVSTIPDFLAQWLLPGNGSGFGLPINLTLYVNTTRTYVTYGVEAIIEGSIAGTGTPLSNTLFYLYDELENGTVAKILTGTLDRDGRARITVIFDTLGKHRLYAVIPASHLYREAKSNMVDITVDKLPTKTILQVDKTKLEYGEKLHVAVRVIDRIGNRPVKTGNVVLYAVKNNTIVYSSEKQLSNGQATYTIELGSVGEYVVYAVFPAQGFYEGSRSDNITITVEYPINPLGGLPVILRTSNLIHVLVLGTIILVVVAVYGCYHRLRK